MRYKNYMYNDLNYVIVGNEINVCTTQNFKIAIFNQFCQLFMEQNS